MFFNKSKRNILYKYSFWIFLIHIILVSECLAKTKAQPIQNRIELLEVYYQKANENKEKKIYEKLFFEAFPDTFEELQAIYGYASNIPAPLYCKGEKHILGFFNKLKSILAKKYYSKIIHIAIGGRWEADGINYFQHGLHYRVMQNPELTFAILDTLSDEKAESFFFFFFHGIHPRWNKIPDKLEQSAIARIRLKKLMKQGFERAMKESGH